MKIQLVLPILLLLFFVTSCSSGSEDEVIIKPPSGSDVTYTGTVKAIIDGACLDCHDNPPSNGAPTSLTTYQNVKDAVIGSGLIGRVESGNMPQGGTPLTDSQVQAIKDWESGGFKP